MLLGPRKVTNLLLQFSFPSPSFIDPGEGSGIETNRKVKGPFPSLLPPSVPVSTRHYVITMIVHYEVVVNDKRSDVSRGRCPAEKSNVYCRCLEVD